jgi:hypothetical protein
LNWHEYFIGLVQNFSVEICLGALLIPMAYAAWTQRRSAWIYGAVSPMFFALLVYFNLYVRHEYYWIAVTPAIVLIAARGTTALVEVIGSKWGRMPVVAATCLVACGVLTVCAGALGVLESVVNQGRNQPIYMLLPFCDTTPEWELDLVAMSQETGAKVPEREVVMVIGDCCYPAVAFYSRHPVIYEVDWPSISPETRRVIRDTENPEYALVMEAQVESFEKSTKATVVERFKSATLFRISGGLP